MQVLASEECKPGRFMEVTRSKVKGGLRPVYYMMQDVADILLGRKESLIPPRRLRSIVGPADIRRYRELAEEFFNYFRDLCVLRPDESLLEIGCGCCPLALPLSEFLSERGSYHGFDINTKLITWCKENISLKHPNFDFLQADIFNKAYNPNGKHVACEYHFPYDQESFDFVFAKSVFTHMLPKDVENYFSEISRVLKRHGRCLITYFLMNQESLKTMVSQNSSLDFKYNFRAYRSTDKDTPEYAICYEETFVQELYKKYGLEILQPIHYGSWSGGRDALNYQDIIIARKA